MIQLTRRYRFSASHRLHAKTLPAAQNQEIYGKCNNPFGHGHNYEVEVTVRGEVDGRTGRVVDLGDLDRIVQQTVTGPLEHRNLNEEAPEFAELVPTTENLAVVIDRRLRDAWLQAFPEERPQLERVRIWETERNIFEI